MKKIILFCVVALLAGCATATFERGDMKLTVKRPIFATVNATATSANGDTVTINTNTSVQVDQLASMALQGYAKYMSGGLMSAPVAKDTPTVGPTINPFNPMPVPTN